MARVHAVMRRYYYQNHVKESLSFGSLRLDTESMVASVETSADKVQNLELTPTEFSLLATLLRAPTKVFSRQELLEKCLPESEAMERVMDMHIYKLRKNWRMPASLECCSPSGASDTGSGKYGQVTQTVIFIALDFIAGPLTGYWLRDHYCQLYVGCLSSGISLETALYA